MKTPLEVVPWWCLAKHFLLIIFKGMFQSSIKVKGSLSRTERFKTRQYSLRDSFIGMHRLETTYGGV